MVNLKRVFYVVVLNLILTAPIAQGAGTMKVFYHRSTPKPVDDTHCAVDVVIAGGTPPTASFNNTIPVVVSAATSDQQIDQQCVTAVVAAWNDPNTGSGLANINANDVVKV